MARFRNLLVHEYAEVDDRRVHGFLAADIQDLEQLAGSIVRAFPELSSSG